MTENEKQTEVVDIRDIIPDDHIWAFPTNGKRRKPKGKNEHELNEFP